MQITSCLSEFVVEIWFSEHTKDTNVLCLTNGVVSSRSVGIFMDRIGQKRKKK